MIPKSAVLIVVDVQNGFIRDASAPVVPTIVELVDRWQRNDGATVFTRYFNYPHSPFERLIRWTALQGPPDTDIVGELQPYLDRATAVLDKPVYSFFTAEGDTLVRSHGWSDIYVCGIATESCVLKTAVDAFERNLTPWVIAEASRSHGGQSAHDAGLLVIRRFIGASQVVRLRDLGFLEPDA